MDSGQDILTVANSTVTNGGNSTRIDMGTEAQYERDVIYLSNDRFKGNVYVGTGGGNDHMAFSNSQFDWSLVANAGSGYDTYYWTKIRHLFRIPLLKNFEKRV
jgi:hypothetical protein